MESDVTAAGPEHRTPRGSKEDATSSTEQIYHHLSTYPFNSDTEYLVGLAAILGHPAVPPTDSELREHEDLVIQAQCFYFTRKYNLSSIDINNYRQWLSSQSTTTTVPIVPSTVATSDPIKELTAITNGAESPSQLQNLNSSSNASTAQDTSSIEPPDTRSPIPNRPHAPTPSTAAAATTLSVQPHQQIPSPPPTTTAPNPEPKLESEPTPPYPTTFAEIVDLITQNKPIPGIETIPDTVLDPGSSKADKATRRKKPWERDDISLATPAAAEVEPGAEQGSSTGGIEEAIGKIDLQTHAAAGKEEGVLKILQPGAVPDSGLIASDD